ncbi:dihydrolipoyl dehydrogenase [Riemerella anatipestifer]|uniref:Dihydrolipoyl dehydrogenase n=1 Tax=Riemerella anatipestifer (strain ATCC 11845 / DSM 15868 / JCM 9532 / NCTC 11014) TaxID=693978 RepID=E4T9G3_RIEAD|nr:dihydrolipoyl dehydrogenase [Riemerella anatipestifer]ADQ81644.1 dihydrolipoamide dehydrogenase [Riemerella anatipestifer ATCC 11845 = DSM 15868]AFD55657.1 dihydrolipoamide dehydrogenase [Riemerella anatipestifer ATCC 11845 = DSM 15868]AGC40448.1 Pyruvate/2-oxoglutarate dehydrogenase complex, dihydrolipoamide dehydrogenase (E3) component,-related enzyme [Riemerella anatipestifer RA-CH-2]AKP68899.1 dihydrolipoamide dehydrogenase [Riemerella anatipestifer]AKQ39198.1 dihydrolipoamide dehydroge
MSQFDVTVIGSGPGGYVAAIRCAQLGFKTAIIEKYPTLGGTCLNVGCIPSKALLDSSEHFENAKHNFANHGIVINEPKADLARMVERKNEVVEQTTKGINFLMDKNKITVFEGVGSFETATKIKVIKNDGSTESIESKYTIIATGSKPSSLPFISLDKERIITSTEALNLKEIPKHLIVIGGGVIGLELGSVYKRLGSEVTVVEYLDKIIPGMDGSLSKELQKVLKKQGMKFMLSTAVSAVERKGDAVVVTAKDKKGAEVSVEGDYCLVSVGRRPYTEGLGLENAGVDLDERGRVKVNDHLQTNVSNIYAIGDVVKGAMLAHKAEEEGVFVAETLAGQKPHINYNLIPGVVYTWPEVAGVGKTEEQLKEEGVSYKVGSFPMRALGRSRASGDIDGLIKVLADEKTDEILGVHMIGARAADMIAEAVVAMEFRASAEDISRISHAHPTFTEAIKEAALDATGKRALHM